MLRAYTAVQTRSRIPKSEPMPRLVFGVVPTNETRLVNLHSRGQQCLSLYAPMYQPKWQHIPDFASNVAEYGELDC